MKIFKEYPLLFVLLLFGVSATHAQTRQYTRLKGYYRVYQTTNSRLAYFIDGMMEFYVPVKTSGGKGKDDLFIDRKFLGERRRKAPQANGDDTFVRMCLPNLEQNLLVQSIQGEEYSTRNNGDIYRWADKCGSILEEKQKVGGVMETVKTVNMDDLVGQKDHELDLSQLKMYGIVARMTRYDESETYLARLFTEGTDTAYTTCPLLAAQKHQTFFARYRGDDADERIDVWCDFYVTDRMMITAEEKKRIDKAKNHILTFSIPPAVPPVEKEVEAAWKKMVEY